MRKIINGLLYDTDKAKVLYEHKEGANYSITRLCKTQNGNYFFYIYVYAGNDKNRGFIEPTGGRKAVNWLAVRNTEEAIDLAISEFSEYVKEA